MASQMSAGCKDSYRAAKNWFNGIRLATVIVDVDIVLHTAGSFLPSVEVANIQRLKVRA